MPTEQKAMTTPTRIDMERLELALDWTSSGGPFEHQAFIDRLTGSIHYQSAYGEIDEELPEDIDDGSRYIAMPHKNDLDLGRELVFEFVSSKAPQLEASVFSVFHKRGAYRRFKAILERADLLEQWYEFQVAATRAALVRWAEHNGFSVE